MSNADISHFDIEFLRFLRNSDVLTTEERGVQTATDNSTSSGSATILVNRNNVKNVRSVTIDGVLQTYGTGYTYDVNYSDAGTIKLQITLSQAPTAGAAVSVVYDYGGPDHIFDELSNEKVTAKDFPRVGFDYETKTEEIEAGGGLAQRTTAMVELVVQGYDRKVLNRVTKAIRDAVNANKKGLYTARYMHLIGTGPALPAPEGYDKIIQRNVTIHAEFDEEV